VLYFSVRWLTLPTSQTAFFDGENHAIQLPPVNSASFALRFLETLCHSLQSDNLLSSQPFSSYKDNTENPVEHDQNKPGERNCRFLYYASILYFILYLRILCSS
jgi:hypothetical protein